MGLLITSKTEYDTFIKTYNVDIDERWVIEYSLDQILKRKINYSFWLVLEKNDIIRFNGILTPYLGFQSSPRDIDPYTYCIYRIGRRVYYHKAKPREPISPTKIPVKKTQKDISEPFDVSIKENDNELLVITKELLNGITVNSFKNLFSSVSDYNNIKREIIEGNGQMTWNRFRLMLELLGFDYSLKVSEKPKLVTQKPATITVPKKKKQ